MKSMPRKSIFNRFIKAQVEQNIYRNYPQAVQSTWKKHFMKFPVGETLDSETDWNLPDNMYIMTS